MSKKQCTIAVEDKDAVTVRKGRHLSDVLAETLAAHLGHPLLVLAVVADDPLVLAADPDSGWADELALRDAFCAAARAYSKAVTDRWDAEAEERQAQQADEQGMHAGCCECGSCLDAEYGLAEEPPPQDERDRLLEEELRASAKAWPTAGEGSKP